MGKRDEEERGGDHSIALHSPFFELDRFATCQSLTPRFALGEVMGIREIVEPSGSPPARSKVDMTSASRSHTFRRAS